jgi:hypothetical protein
MSLLVRRTGWYGFLKNFGFIPKLVHIAPYIFKHARTCPGMPAAFPGWLSFFLQSLFEATGAGVWRAGVCGIWASRTGGSPWTTAYCGLWCQYIRISELLYPGMNIEYVGLSCYLRTALYTCYGYHPTIENIDNSHPSQGALWIPTGSPIWVIILLTEDIPDITPENVLKTKYHSGYCTGCNCTG